MIIKTYSVDGVWPASIDGMTDHQKHILFQHIRAL